MGLPVTVYSWDDTGAPSLGTRTPSDWVNILKKCLVEGYGSKQPAGWTLEFENGPAEIVLRNSPTVGSGGYVKFWYKTSPTTSNDIMFMHNAPLIGSINPDWTNLAGAGFRNVFMKGDTSITRWRIYATAACFYLVTYGSSGGYGGLVSNTTTYLPFIFVGDFQSFFSWDDNTFITIGFQGLTADVPLTTTSAPAALNAFTANQSMFRLYETTGYTSPKVGTVVAAGLGVAQGYGTSSVTTTPPDDFNMLFMPAVVGLVGSFYDLNASSSSTNVRDSANAQTVHSNLQPAQRGILPGLNLTAFFGFATQPNIYEWAGADGDTYHLMPQWHYGGSRVWLKLGEWYA